MRAVVKVAFYGGCQFAGALAAFYAFFLSTSDPASWLARHTRPH